MKEKILAAIRAKFPKVNLSKKRLDAIAAKIETKVIDDETKIDAAIDDYNDFNPLAEIAQNDDKIRNLEAKVKPAPPKKDEVKTEDEEKEAPPKDETPGWALKLLEKVEKLESEKSQSTIKSKLDVLLKDIPASSNWPKRVLPVKDEDIDAFVADVTADYEAFTKDLSDKGLSVIPIPGGGNPKPLTKEATQEQINNVVDKIMI